MTPCDGCRAPTATLHDWPGGLRVCWECSQLVACGRCGKRPWATIDWEDDEEIWLCLVCSEAAQRS